MSEDNLRSCEHVASGFGARGTFEKPSFKSSQPIDESDQAGEDGVSPTKELNTPCKLCNIIYPFWKEHFVSPHSHSGFDEKKADSFRPNSVNDGTIKVVLQPRQYGEAYHVLMCGLLQTWNGTRDALNITIGDPQNDEIPDLLKWYTIKSVREVLPKDKEGKPIARNFDGKKSATGYITSTFERCYNVRRASRELSELEKLLVEGKVAESSTLEPCNRLIEALGNLPEFRELLLSAATKRKKAKPKATEPPSTFQSCDDLLIALKKLESSNDLLEAMKKLSGPEAPSPTLQACNSRLKLLEELLELKKRFLKGEIKPSVWPDQAAIFECFRAMLDCIYGWPERNRKSVEGSYKLEDICADYLRPSYSAKYWLNRYLRLTEQGTLPKGSKVSRMAVIHYRGTDAHSSVGRLMDKDTITKIAKAIQVANTRADLAREARFSHIILYGDFVSSEGLSLKNDVLEALRDSTSIEQYDEKVEVLYISRPWLEHGKESKDDDDKKTNDKEINDKKTNDKKTNDEKTNDKKTTNKKTIKKKINDKKINDKKINDKKINEKDNDDEVLLFWKRFRDPDLDPLPLQVKILAIWVALCKRYNPNICVIGHRSGFVEGAALVGIPTFYLNNERPNTHSEQGDILWKSFDQQNPKRLQRLANVMNTLIPLDVLTDKDSKKEFDETYEHEIMAALFTFMCCDVNLGRWRDLKSKGNKPGWVARVEMMHDTCANRHPGIGCDNRENFDDAVEFLKDAVPAQAKLEDFDRYEKEKASFRIGDEPKSIMYPESASTYQYEVKTINEFLGDPKKQKCKEDLIELFTEYCGYDERRKRRPETGQEWIQRRYRFAVNPELEPGILLQAWTPTAPGVVMSDHERSRIDDKRRTRAVEAIKDSGREVDRHWHELIRPIRFESHKSTMYCIQKMSSFLGQQPTQSPRWRRPPEFYEVQYACLHWIDHFVAEKNTDAWIIANFLRKHFLHWIEFMGYIGRLSDVDELLDALIIALDNSPFKENGRMLGVANAPHDFSVVDFVSDAKSYVEFNYYYIQKYPIRSHEAGLLFAPKKSLIRQQFSSEVPAWDPGSGKPFEPIPKASIPNEHASIGVIIMFSLDGWKVTALSRDKTRRVWVVKGSETQIKDEDTDKLLPLVFSSQGTMGSGSPKKTVVRLWNGGNKKVLFRVIGELPS